MNIEATRYVSLFGKWLFILKGIIPELGERTFAIMPKTGKAGTKQ
ncbi:hypothetical protein J42TS3_04510 [Paenibacillus vini]|uniref:Uncharacterized protein n=1 Tax=Paenibacillus vini TaxID=1476024 RepID=A0ABQ4M616_9BACL|nr:hypothetical protein J42TS3_04510 [Paenibacillus vini]